MNVEKSDYKGWPNSLRLGNGDMDLVVTTDVGPRIVFCGFQDGPNLMKNYEPTLGQTGGDEWRIYGGHRLWHAPEADPRTYAPDNEPVPYELCDEVLQLRPVTEQSTGIRKEIDIQLDAKENRVTLTHRLWNENLWSVTFAPWCLTVMAQGGRAIIPQEEYRPHPEYLLPARPLVLWHYTDLSDSRWTFSTRYIQLHQHPSATTKQKVGLLNRKGWAAYELDGHVLIKRYAFDPQATYPDFGCNTETYTDADMLELETVGPLQSVQPGQCAEHVETWTLHRAEVGTTDDAIDASLLPLV